MKISALQYLNATGILIGSRKFDLHILNSDYDYVLKNTDKQEVEAFFRKRHIQITHDEEYADQPIGSVATNTIPMLNTSLIKFDHELKSFHLLFYPTKYYNCFVEINYLMKRLIDYKREPFTDKTTRISTYNRLMMSVFASRGLFVPPLT